MEKATVKWFHARRGYASPALKMATIYSCMYPRCSARRLHSIRAQGAADSSRVQKIAKAYGGEAHCTQDGCTYDFDSRFWFTESGPALLLTEWDYVGLRPWRVTARIQQRNNSTVEFDTLVGRGRGWL